MRISELSERSGVSTATIKFYVREGLLPSGERHGYNQTAYGEVHLARLRLIRAMIELAGLPLAAVERVLAASEDDDMPLGCVLGIAQQAIPAPQTRPSATALNRVRDLMRERGWVADADNPGIAQTAGILDAYTAIGRDDLLASLPRYAAAADLAADADLDAVAASRSREQMGETVVVGTVLGDGLFAGLRRIAQEHESRRRYGITLTSSAPPDSGSTASDSTESGSTTSDSTESRTTDQEPLS